MTNYFTRDQNDKYFNDEIETGRDSSGNYHGKIDAIKKFDIKCENIKEFKAYSRIIGHVAKQN